MNKLILLCVLVLSLVFVSCNKSNIVNITPEDIYNGSSIYPKVDGKWTGGNNPIYSPAGWIGDVMPYYENDTFHIFYLRDARNGSSGFHPWAEISTTDLTDYKDAGVVIPYGTIEEPDNALGTGSVIKMGGTYYAYYSGVNARLATKDVILLATSKNLYDWKKQDDFIMYPETSNGYNKFDFRDPYVFFNKEVNKYWMLVCGQKNGDAAVMLYTSTDPTTGSWILQPPLFTTSEYPIPECPQVFKWGDYWYLVFSDNSSENVTHYRVSTSSTGPWTEPENDIFDGQYMYASKVAQGKDHTYLFGWVPTKSGFNDEGVRGWGGNLVVHELTQNEDGTLNVIVPENIKKMFKTKTALNTIIKSTEIAASGNSFTFEKAEPNTYVLFDRLVNENMITAKVGHLDDSSHFGFQFGKSSKAGDKSYYKIEFNLEDNTLSAVNIVNGTPQIDAQVPLWIKQGKEYDVTVVIDKSVCEVYVNHKVALSSRIYSLEHHFWGLFAAKGAATFSDVQLFKP